MVGERVDPQDVVGWSQVPTNSRHGGRDTGARVSRQLGEQNGGASPGQENTVKQGGRGNHGSGQGQSYARVTGA